MPLEKLCWGVDEVVVGDADGMEKGEEGRRKIERFPRRKLEGNLCVL